MTQRLKLTKTGVEELTRELELKQEELRNLGQYKSQAAENEGDTWHDNFAFEQTEIKERALNYEISRIQHQIKTAEIIDEDLEGEEGLVKLGSKVRVYMEYSDGDGEEDTFILIGGQGKSTENKISINSPLGKCVLGKAVNFEGQYNVNGNIIKVKVLEIK